MQQSGAGFQRQTGENAQHEAAPRLGVQSEDRPQFAGEARSGTARRVFNFRPGRGVQNTPEQHGAKDTVALAKFYQAAFGMQEVNRIGAGAGPEIFVNFGGTINAAKANKSEPIVIMHRDSDDLKDPIPHVILNVKDMTATVAAIKAAGGSMAGDPRPFGNTGVVIGMAIDPAGNRLELIQRP